MTGTAQAAQRLRQLGAHLQTHPDTFASGDSDCPLAVVHLAHALRQIGADGIELPRCIRCRQPSADLPATRPGGRICLACYRQDRRGPCARCGRHTRADHRRDEGLICRPCRDAEPQSRGPCTRCGYERPLRTTARLCDSCIPRPLHTCGKCGNLAPAAARTPAGPLCARCRQDPAVACGNCGKVRPTALKATAEHPNLCNSCVPRKTGTVTPGDAAVI